MQTYHKEVDTKWNILKLLQWTTSYFKSHNVDSPRSASEILLAHVLNLKRIDLYVRYDQPLTDKELLVFKSLIKRRIKKEPVAYIIGSKGFWSLELSVSPYVLIPRPDTETLVEVVLDTISSLPDKNTMSILELGTGSGAIILSVASEFPDGSFTAIDYSVKAIEIAKKNAVRCNLLNKVGFIAGDWFSPIIKGAELFDIIISNPPYIPTSQIPNLQPEITDYEPLLALDGGSNGLDCLNKIIFNAQYYLKPGGCVILEIGYEQGRAVTEIIERYDCYTNIEIIKDYANNDRVIKFFYL